jgi:hypothetical protein
VAVDSIAFFLTLEGIAAVTEKADGNPAVVGILVRTSIHSETFAI